MKTHTPRTQSDTAFRTKATEHFERTGCIIPGAAAEVARRIREAQDER